MHDLLLLLQLVHETCKRKLESVTIRQGTRTKKIEGVNFDFIKPQLNQHTFIGISDKNV